MDRAKATVNKFMSKSGHHDTTVEHESGQAVKHETVKPTQHEEVKTAVNKEVHQDHYRHVVQPVRDREVRPEQHTHRAGEVVNREFDHRDDAATERALRAEGAKFRDQRTTTDTTHSQSYAPTVEGEQIHHHVHEIVHPVIEKETVQPHVVHTTVPIHEVHHNPARHLGTTTLPAVGMDEFNRQGRTTHTEAFEGCPRGIGQSEGGVKARKPARRSSSSSSSSSSGGDDAAKAHRTRSEGNRSAAAGRHVSGGGGLATTESVGQERRQPSLMDRVNPMTDADGDGRKGFMS
ncbi:hypothetical protein N658DRAFT_558453 [Parathielavia hyrcaniae]|uniref:Allergen n=1 Tax=Parathielavia hyrcaniae TaxID=113614 RepID=A0AAN6Q4U8_9PEZI|nr:hypothetical protein N658DRAFT_558453 [Parathielavia hyrcaniae]